MKLSIVIPCLNEEETIEKVINEAYVAAKKNKIKEFEIIVSDSGSADESIKIIKKNKKAKLIHVPIPGYGAALHWGIMAARGEYVFFADADLSYDFGELKKFIKYIDQKKDLVLGSRLKGRIQKRAMPFLNRYIGTPLLTFLIRVIYRIKTTDCNSGMRMVRRNFYKKLNMRNSGMEWASELLIKTALNSGKYEETPIVFHKDKRTRAPHLLRWADGWRHLKAIFLLRPDIFVIPILILAIFSILSFNKSFYFSFFFLLMAIALFLSYLAVKLLYFAIDGSKSKLVTIMRKLPIPFLAIVITIAGFIFLVSFPSKYPQLKLVVSSFIMIFNMWVFLVETIKTHLINRLP
jgi:glycosyltransferase involved in cell wall biosynthesis